MGLNLGSLFGGGPTTGAGGGGGIISNNGGLGGMMNGLSSSLGINLSGIPFIGGMFPNPNEAAMSQAIKDAGNAYGAMRPLVAQGYQNVLGNVNAAYSPAQDALSQMYGSRPSAQQQTPPPMAAAPSSPTSSAPRSGGSFGGGDPLSGLLGGLPGFDPSSALKGFSSAVSGLPGFGGSNPLSGVGGPIGGALGAGLSPIFGAAKGIGSLFGL